jgi:hypothetical protein
LGKNPLGETLFGETLFLQFWGNVV